jgi:PKD repeat protein
LTSINWSFGDGSISTDPAPSHTFIGAGHYTASLKYTTQSGCTGTVYTNTIIIDAKIKSDITITPNPVCGFTPASFSIATNIPDLSVCNWNFGDGNSSIYLSPAITHSYGASGVYTVTLHVKNIGGCDTTMTKKITVNPPFPQITGHTNTCEGTRGEVVFTQASVQATTVVWNFGDGATATTPGNQATIKHVYTKTGSYHAFLTAVNDQCSLSVNDPIAVDVLLKQSPLLTGLKTAACSNAPVDIQISGLDKNPLQGDNLYYYNNYYYAGYYFQRTEYRDGNTFKGSRSDNGWNYRWITIYNAVLSNFKTGEKDMRFILTSYGFGCQDTTNFMPLAIKGATGGFKVVADKLCYQSPVILQDTSHSTPDNPILIWQWNFGDGQTATKNKGGTVSHTYANPGGYNASLQITDAAGCSANIPYTQYVNVYGPKAAFSASGTDVHLNTVVYFYNNTNDYGNYNTQYKWDF